VIQGKIVRKSVLNKDIFMNVNPKTRTLQLSVIQKGPRIDLEYFNLISIHARNNILLK
jgi:hypothetical protein